VTTHDLPTICGLWSGSDLRAQEALGLHPNRRGTEGVRRRLVSLAGGPSAPKTPGDRVVATHAALARTPSRLVAAALEDVACVAEQGQVVLGVANGYHRLDALPQHPHRSAQPIGLVDAGRQHHQRALVVAQLHVEAEVDDGLPHHLLVVLPGRADDSADIERG